MLFALKSIIIRNSYYESVAACCCCCCLPLDVCVKCALFLRSTPTVFSRCIKRSSLHHFSLFVVTDTTNQPMSGNHSNCTTSNFHPLQEKDKNKNHYCVTEVMKCNSHSTVKQRRTKHQEHHQGTATRR